MARRDGPRRARDPGPDGPRRGRRHEGGDRGDAASTTSRSATGTRPSRARPAPTTYAYSGAPEPVAVDQDGAGKVLLVTLDDAGRQADASRSRSGASAGRGSRSSTSTRRASTASRTSIAKLSAKADPDLVLDVRLTGVRPDELDVDPDEVEEQLKGSFLRLRVRDASMPALTEGALPSADTIAGAFIRDVEGRIAELEADPSDATTRRGGGAPRRPPPRPAAAGRPRGHPVRITQLTVRDFRRYREFEVPLAPGPDDRPRPERGRQDDDPAGARARPHPEGDAGGADMDGFRSWDAPEDARPVIAIEFEIDDEERRRSATGLAREGVPRPRRARSGSRSTARSITDPTLADQALAELTGIPTRGVLPLDRLDPPPRAGRPRPRRGGAPRPPPGVDQRRRPRHVAGASESSSRRSST